jgi:co-chaperonin GroES (HSP10)
MSALPVPTGYRLLIEMPKFDDKMRSGLYRPEETKKLEETASVVGTVVGMGPDAYQDLNRFPAGPWCNVGDYVVMRSYSGTRLKIGDKEYRLINDDTVEAVVDCLDAVERA